MSSLSAAFLSARPAGGWTPEGRLLLEERLAAMLTAAQDAWPGVIVSPGPFARHLGERVGAGQTPEATLAALGRAPAADLYLACACASGDPAALRALEDGPLREVPLFLAHLHLPPDRLEEVRQALRARLLVAAEGPARIAAYGGRGPLRGFLRVAAVRTALNLLPPHAEPSRTEAPPLPRDPELDYLRARYHAAFTTAARDAFARLTPRQRNLLRLHYVSGLSGTEIGRLLRAHQSTVSRWLAAAQGQVRDEMHRLLRERLRVGAAELESLGRLMTSLVELSLGALLATDEEAGRPPTDRTDRQEE